MITVYRPVSGRLRLRLNGASADFWSWLKDHRVKKDGRAYTLPQTHFRAVIAEAAREGDVTVITDRRIGTARCDTRCVKAVGDDCDCSCGGANHGGSIAGYVEVGETTLVRLGDRQRVTRVFRKRP